MLMENDVFTTVERWSVGLANKIIKKKQLIKSFIYQVNKWKKHDREKI